MNMEMLREQHDEIITLARELREAVVRAPADAGVAPVRWKLARLLIAHLGIEDKYLYPAMMKSTDVEAKAVACQFHNEMGALSARFTEYMQEWTERRIAAAPTVFVDATVRILDALEKRVSRETEKLYPLAPDGWISLSPRAA